ncbi:Pentatricopeptide repeat-containing protein, chloroplastic [Symbiodinium microadriaticum]|uniref:Pentatricopeptide repeat-containing protein, chloroplastic n=1 Tax=Symbiodinium microadriaticum TaxID=2951 RepID=A0A1Q9EBZ4_SYMMI|nr:Pentatricopeptide repeat-containing protein, chloroplastic [Symbiodinium microadriaticum]
MRRLRPPRGARGCGQAVQTLAEAQALVASIRDGSLARQETAHELQIMHRRQALTKLSEVTMAVSKAATVSLWEDAVWLLEGAKQAPRMQPDMILYGAVMSACERARQWRRALAAFAEAKAQGLEPGLVATSIAITAYGRGALWEKSIEALRQLSDNDLQPNQITYNATISACERAWAMGSRFSLQKQEAMTDAEREEALQKQAVHVLATTVSGQSFEATVLPSDTVRYLKSCLAKSSGIAEYRQRLLLDVRVLKENELLQSLGANAELTMVIGPEIPGWAQELGFDGDHPALLRGYFQQHASADQLEDWLEDDAQCWMKLENSLEANRRRMDQLSGWNHEVKLFVDDIPMHSIHVSPGEEVHLRAAVRIQNNSADGCIQQLVLALDTSIVGELYNGVAGRGRSASVNCRFVAPAVPGAYMLWRKNDLQYSMDAARRNFQNEVRSASDTSQQSRPALALLCEMPEVAVPPDLISFNAAINACEKASDWQAALEVFMATPHGLPNEITYNTTISACHKGSHWQGALDLFCSMELRALAPNVITHSATMASCLRGDAWQKALEMYGRLPVVEREGNPILVGLMLQADTDTLGAVLEAMPRDQLQCCWPSWLFQVGVAGDTSSAAPADTDATEVPVADTMAGGPGVSDAGLRPLPPPAAGPDPGQPAAVAATVSPPDLSSAPVSSSEVAFLFYVTMVTPLQGTAAPGAAPIAAFCAVALSMSPLAAGTPATTALRAGVNEALGAAKAWEEAVAHIERLAKPGCRAVDALCFTAAVRTCGACGEWEWAMYLMDKMQGQGFLPDVVTATLVLSACRQSGQWQTALGILREKMPSLGVEPSNSSIKTVLAACFEANQLPAGLELLKESPLLRDSAECSRALTHVASAQVWEEALWITAHMLEHGLELSPGVQLRQVPQLAQLAVSLAPSAPPPPRPQRPPPPVRRTEDEKAVGDVEEQGQQEETQTMPSMAVKAAEPDQQEEQRELSYRLTDSGAALIDLHGLPVEVAKIAVQVALEDLLLGPPTGKSPAKELGDFIIVTGVGNNSPGGIAVVRPAVIALLREELQIRVLETRTDGPGRLRVPASELRKLRGVPKPTSLDLSRAAFQALTTPPAPPAATATMNGSKPASETSGNAASKKGDYKEAITICQPFKDKYDKCFDVWYRQGFLRHQLNNPCDPEFEDYRACILEELAARGLRLPGSR